MMPLSSARHKYGPSDFQHILRTKYRRLFALPLVFFMCWSSIQPWNFAHATSSPPAPVPPDHAGKFTRAAGQIEQLLTELDQNVDNEAVVSDKRSAINAKKAELDALHQTLVEDFNTTESMILDKNLSDKIRQRQLNAKTKYLTGYQALKDKLSSVDAGYDEYRNAVSSGVGVDVKKSELKQKIKSAKDDARLGGAGKKHKALDPENLPFNVAPPTQLLPRTSDDEYASILNPIHVAMAGPLSAGMLSGMDQPQAADLVETVDVQITPRILSLAATLENNPRKIYDYVSNNIKFVPTYGSLQGADACLQTRLCNAADTSSLLIALLRASNIPARYVMGTIDVPIEKLKNWVGNFTDDRSALTYIASSGTPAVSLIDSAGSIIAGRIEHVWVEAYIDYVPSRGAVMGPGDTWIPLDASFKAMEYSNGVDLSIISTESVDTMFNEFLADATTDGTLGSATGLDPLLVDQKLADFGQQIIEAVPGYEDGVKMSEMVSLATITPRNTAIFSGALPNKVIARSTPVSVLPDSFRHRVTFQVTDASGYTNLINYSLPFPSLAAKRVTVSFSPESSDDTAVVEALFDGVNFSDYSTIPTTVNSAYLVHVVPELRVDGELLASGGALTLGDSSRFKMIFERPGSSAHTVDNHLTAGTYNAVVFNTGRVESPESRAALAQSVKNEIDAGNLENASRDNIIGEFLYGAGLMYWSQLELNSLIASHAANVATSRMPSEGIFTYNLSVSYLFGVPRTVSPGGLITDVDTDIQAVVSKDGNSASGKHYMSSTGMLSSRAENGIYDQLINGSITGQGISAISYIEEAGRRNIPVHTITSENINTVLPVLNVDNAVKSDVINGVAAGKIVTIPQTEFEKDGFVGVGYIVYDAATGAAAYLISSGLAGGGFDLPTLDPLLVALLGILLIGIGIFASGALALVAALAGIALIIYDAVSTYQSIAKNNPNLTGDQLSLVKGLLGLFAGVGIVLAIVGLAFGSALAFVAFSLYWIYISVAGAGIVGMLANLFNSSNSSLLNRWRIKATQFAFFDSRVRILTA